MAQMARHPSVHITDTTPAHTAATLRPDRHHTHGHQVAIVGWRLYEPYGRIAFVAISSPTAHNQAETSQLCTLHMCLRAQFQSHAAGKPTAGGVRDKSKRSCLHFPTSRTGEGWLRALRARATAGDADSTAEVSHGHWEPWHRPWRHRRRWTAWPTAERRESSFRFR